MQLLKHRFIENKRQRKKVFCMKRLRDSFLSFFLSWHHFFPHYFHCPVHCVGLYMTCAHWPWWVLSHTKGQRHHLQKAKDPPNTHWVVYLIPYQLLKCGCQLKRQPDFPLICWLIFQLTNRLPDSLHQINVWLATIIHICMHMYIQLQCCCNCYLLHVYLMVIYIDWWH